MDNKGPSFAMGATNWQGPAIAGNANWEQAVLMAAQANQFRDGR